MYIKMKQDLFTIVIVVGFAVLVWVPAIVWSVWYVIKKGNRNKTLKT